MSITNKSRTFKMGIRPVRKDFYDTYSSQQQVAGHSLKVRDKIVFWGTPNFAAIILEKLIISGFNPIAVITAQDRPVGRKQIRTPSPVKKLALKHNIEILQPQSLKKNLEIVTHLSHINPDLFILAAYGLIIPEKILNIPQYGCLNIHPSLLPKYRGASPIQAAILNSDKTTGVTIIKMDEKVDHGPIVADVEFKMQNTEFTYSQLSEKLARLGGELLIKILPKYLRGEIKPIPQNHSKATITRRLTKQDGKIDFKKSAAYINAMSRAYDPWPGAFATINDKNKILKILKSDVIYIYHQKQPGKIFLTNDKKLAVACKKDALVLESIQLEGKKPMSGKDFYNGYPDIINTILKPC